MNNEYKQIHLEERDSKPTIVKVGKDPMHIMHIYNFNDKDNRKFVVGSMPKHLRIVSY